MRSFLWLVFLVLLGWSCEEIGPEINPGGGLPQDTSQLQARQVLLEEFTGVRCVNCPAASQHIQELKGLYGDQLIVVAIHTGFFSPPYPESQYDFRTSDGDNILSLMGEPFGYPSAVVDRKLFDGEADLQLGQTQWAGYIAQEAAKEPLLRISTEHSFNPANRNVSITLDIRPSEDIPAEDVRANVAVTESGIIDAQLTPEGKVDDYEHKNVFRGMLTNYDGNLITEPLLAGETVSLTYSGRLEASWVPENCWLVAFVSLGGQQKDVLQAVEVPVVE